MRATVHSHFCFLCAGATVSAPSLTPSTPFLLLCAATVSGAGPVSLVGLGVARLQHHRRLEHRHRLLTPRAAWRPAARALNVFKIEYRASVNAANQSYIESAGGVENVLMEMWQTLPDHKRNASASLLLLPMFRNQGCRWSADLGPIVGPTCPTAAFL